VTRSANAPLEHILVEVYPLQLPERVRVWPTGQLGKLVFIGGLSDEQDYPRKDTGATRP
jgi:hypothetical protein